LEWISCGILVLRQHFAVPVLGSCHTSRALGTGQPSASVRPSLLSAQGDIVHFSLSYIYMGRSRML
jgi:hypothetical protein